MVKISSFPNASFMPYSKVGLLGPVSVLFYYYGTLGDNSKNIPPMTKLISSAPTKAGILHIFC